MKKLLLALGLVLFITNSQAQTTKAEFTFPTDTVLVGTQVTFTNTSKGFLSGTAFTWNFGDFCYDLQSSAIGGSGNICIDTTYGIIQSITHTYDEANTYNIILSAQDSLGNNFSFTKIIYVEAGAQSTCNSGINCDLVCNGGFENHGCFGYAAPDYYMHVIGLTPGRPDFWVNPHSVSGVTPFSGTPDYYDTHTCTSSSGATLTSSYVPNNTLGCQIDHSNGSAYVGLYTFASGGEYREYITSPLNTQMVINQTYKITYYVSLSEASRYATYAPGVYFSNTAPTIPAYVTPSFNNFLSTNASYVANSNSLGIITDKNGWTAITMTYVAKGNERFVTLANFNSDLNSPRTLLSTNICNGTETAYLNAHPGDAYGAYYYIDDISIVPNNNLLALTAVSTSLCSGESTQLVATGGTGTYTWASSPAGTYPNTSVIPVSPTTTTTYTVTCMTAYGCSQTKSITITVKPKPTLNSISNISTCEDNSLAASNFVSTPAGATYTWTNSNIDIGLATSGSGNIPSFYAMNGTGSPISGTITVTPTLNGCTGTSVTYTITVNPLISVTASASPISILTGGSSNLTATVTGGTSTYAWLPSASLNNSTIYNPIATPAASTTYTVTATSNGCSATATITVYVSSPPPQCNVTLNYDIANGTLLSSIWPANTVVGGKNIRISGTVYANANITFSNCNLIMQPNAIIQLQNSAQVKLNEYTHVFSCTDMWNGIYVSSSTQKLTLEQSTFIEDAVNAVVSQNGGQYDISNTIFNKNLKGLDIRTGSSDPGTVKRTIFTSRSISSNASPSSNRTFSTVWTDILTFSAANMKTPNNAEKGVYGIYVTDFAAGGMVLGGPSMSDGSSPINMFDGIKCGIYLLRSSLKIVNNRFQNLLNSSTCMGCYNVTGYGIKAVGTSSGAYALVIGDNGSAYYNTFNNIYSAIDIADYKGTEVYNTIIDNSSTATSPTIGYGVTGIVIKPASNNLIVVKDNTVNNCASGIWINRNYASAISTTSLTINTNTVSANSSGFCTNGIYVTDLVAGTTVVPSPSEIKNNVITETVNCINLSNVKKTINVTDNSVTVRYATTGARNGIKAVGCQNLGIINNHTKYNNVGGTAYTSTGNLLAYGIFLQNSTNMTVKCNLIEDAARSLVFQGTCTSPTATGYGITQNKMRRAQDGFVLTSSGVIGTQGTSTLGSNNYWDLTTTPTFTRSQTYTEVIGANANSKLYMVNITGGASATLPTNNQASFLGNEYSTSATGLNLSSGEPTTCGTPPALMVNPETEEEAVSNTLRSFEGAFDDYIQMLENTITETTLEGEEIHWMRENYVFDAIAQGTVSTDNVVLDSFYNADHNFATFKLIEDAITDQNYVQAGTLNNNLVPVNIIEHNQQTMNTLILAQLLDSAYVYTEDDKNILNDIAPQCPVTCGNAVYQARNLLMAIAGNVLEFEDNCEEAEKKIMEAKSKKTEQSLLFKLYPNPNNGSMMLEYYLASTDIATLEITDVTGKIMDRYELSSAADVLKLNEEGLKNGIYIYHIIVNGKIIKSDKLLIIK